MLSKRYIEINATYGAEVVESPDGDKVVRLGLPFFGHSVPNDALVDLVELLNIETADKLDYLRKLAVQ